MIPPGGETTPRNVPQDNGNAIPKVYDRPVTCPDAETLARYAEANLDDAASERMRAHVDGCPSCRELLVTLVRSSQPSPGPQSDSPWDVPLPGSMLGRYRVTGTRGAGAMGVVLAAYDPQLDRQIALKVLRPDVDGDAPEKGRWRLVREAQLMARVRHANVVTVHDVVVEGARVFIAMELVEGKTVRDWLEARPRSVSEVMQVFVAAGRGLAAAHEAGVVHRDFKPDNVLIDTSGQALVSDFGLAWSQALSPELVSAVSGAASLGISRRSAAIGTPAYMAPEQLMGEAIDARADQFSFCVALFEALYGARPFGGATTTALLEAISAGKTGPSRRAVPKNVSAALMRGLSRTPADRFPSMGALLAALESRRSFVLPLAAAVVVLGLASGLVIWNQRESGCRPMRARLEQAWNPARSAQLAARLPKASALVTKLNALADALRPEWDAACARTDEDAARRRSCLETRVQALEVTAEVVSLPESDVRAVTALVGRLEGPASCRAGELVTLVPAPPGEEARTMIHAARVSAMTADALRHEGKLEEASATATRAVEEAVKSTWRPVEADARLAAAQVFRALGKFKEAEAMLGDALLAAEAGRHFETIARISVQHILVVGTQTVRPEEAEPWVKRAEAALEQLPRPALRAEVDLAITMLRVSQGRLEDALAVSDRTLSWTDQNDPKATADVHALRSLLFLQFGLHGRALGEARLASSQRLELLGPTHPLTMHALLALGEAQARCGLATDALATLRPVLEALRSRKDVSPVALATGLVAMGVALRYRGQHEEALAATLEARELVAKLVGPRHRYSALATRAVAEQYLAMGKLDEARREIDAAVEMGTEAVGAAHRETIESRAIRALVSRSREEADAVIAAVAADASMGQSPLVAARLALAMDPDATEEARSAAVEIARTVRGQHHPDVLRAVVIAGGDVAAERAALQLQR